MIIYWSMILWIFLIYILYDITHKEEIALTDYNLQQGIQRRVPWAYAFLVFGYFIFWASMRHYVADTTAYVAAFNNYSTNFSEEFSKLNWDPWSSEGKGVLFNAYSIFFKCFISDNYTLWLSSIAIFSGVCVMITLRKYCMNADFFLASFLFLAFLCYSGYMLNGMRQFICVAVSFLCCDFIITGKFFKFLTMVAILIFIHSTAIFLIPIYFIARLKPWSKLVWLFIFAMVLITVFAEPFFDKVDEFAQGTSYENDISTYFKEDDGVNPLRVLFYAVPPVTAFVYREKLSKYYEKMPVLSLCVNLSVFTASVYLVGMVTSGIFIGRLPIYSELYDLILIPVLLRICFNENNRKYVYFGYVAVLLLYYYLTGPTYYHSDYFGGF